MRLIDADAFIKEQCNSCDGACEALPCDCLNCDSDCRCDMIQDLQAAPTISPDEVRGVGEWAHLGGDEWCCSECGHVITTEGSWEHPLEVGAKHCENCGARMAEVSEDGD